MDVLVTLPRGPGEIGPLADLVIERLLVSDDVAAAKFAAGSPVDDRAREEAVLDRVRERADGAGLDPDVAVAFFRDQITASKVVQEGLFAHWAAHPEEAPVARPDLCQVRERLDRLTTGLLRELEVTERLRGRSTDCSEGLALAGGPGEARLDALHRRALRTATHSVCAPGEPTARR